jgi:hypothetical protein
MASRLEMLFCVCDRTDVMDIDDKTIEAMAEENEESRNWQSYLTQKLRDIGKERRVRRRTPVKDAKRV